MSPTDPPSPPALPPPGVSAPVPNPVLLHIWESGTGTGAQPCSAPAAGSRSPQSPGVTAAAAGEGAAGTGGASGRCLPSQPWAEPPPLSPCQGDSSVSVGVRLVGWGPWPAPTRELCHRSWGPAGVSTGCHLHPSISSPSVSLPPVSSPQDEA